MKLTPWLLMTALAVGCGGGDDDDDDDDDTADASDDSEVLDGPTVVLETTMGTMVVKLARSEMPITTANFLTYVDTGFYDGTLVHRVVDGRVIQGGGYTSGLTRETPGAPIQLETSDLLSHVHGAISMARFLDDPDSATSQWFIVDWPEQGSPPQPEDFDGKFAAFGLVIEGLDVLAAISDVATTSTGGLDDVPITEIVVTSAHRQ